MNKPQVKIETFKKINGEIQIDYNGAYVGSLRPSPPWFKEDGIDTESIANLIASAPDLLSACKYALGVLESIPEVYAEQIADILDESIDTNRLESVIAKAEGK